MEHSYYRATRTKVAKLQVFRVPKPPLRNVNVAVPEASCFMGVEIRVACTYRLDTNRTIYCLLRDYVKPGNFHSSLFRDGL